jgi:hypothetical protein
MIETVSVGPLPFFFSNVNTQMALRGHSHTAYLYLTWLALPRQRALGFPVFANTEAAIREALRSFTEHAFHDATNEEVARQLFAKFEHWTDPAVAMWVPPLEGSLGPDSPPTFLLHRLTMDVQGVPDRIGHAASLTRYEITREPAETIAEWRRRWEVGE